MDGHSNRNSTTGNSSSSRQRQRRRAKKLRISEQYRAVLTHLREAVESYRLRTTGLRKSLQAAGDVLALRDEQIAALQRQVEAQQAALAAHKKRETLNQQATQQVER